MQALHPPGTRGRPVKMWKQKGRIQTLCLPYSVLLSKPISDSGPLADEEFGRRWMAKDQSITLTGLLPPN